MHVIEKALGREAALILPPGLRTRKLTVRIPLVHIQLLEVLASEAKQSVTKFLELEIEERAGNEKGRLAGIIPGSSRRTTGRTKFRTNELSSSIA